MPDNTTWRSQFITSADGLRLHCREMGDRASSHLPVICLAGLSRSSLDFEDIGAAIAAQDGRFVLAPDYRGRGLSDYDPDWQNYTLMVELNDLQHILNAYSIERAIFLGTSRGGLLTALLATVQPERIAGSILNDIGPVIEREGLIRIKSYLGKIPIPRDYAEGATRIKALFGAHFPALDDAGWLRFAQRSWKGEEGGLAPFYDPQLMNTLTDFDAETPMPDLWPQFMALHVAPLMVIRGMLSDILSMDTAIKMVSGHPTACVLLVQNEGHAPLLEDAANQNAILKFIREIN